MAGQLVLFVGILLFGRRKNSRCLGDISKVGLSLCENLVKAKWPVIHLRALRALHLCLLIDGKKEEGILRRDQTERTISKSPHPSACVYHCAINDFSIRGHLFSVASTALLVARREICASAKSNTKFQQRSSARARRRQVTQIKLQPLDKWT